MDIARALLANVFGLLACRGFSHPVTEVDENNRASRALRDGCAAPVVGNSVELVRPDKLS